MEKTTYLKTLVASIGAFLSLKLGILLPVLVLLTLAMITDYVTGILDAKSRGEINSRTGMWGIIKKLLYGVEVAVAMVVDWTIINVAGQLNIDIHLGTFFGLLVSIWLIFNEIISILENLTRLGTPMPGFLVKFVSTFKVVVESNGDMLADNLENNINNK
ncbi:phage holin family protein [Clostridium butyricum]|uniref:phage holin family protein n=1 Tax=Clostridium butyricum TaxID=1492 RepID=UPI003D3508CC